MLDANHASRVSGRDYLNFFGDIHRSLAPRSYLEIGVQFGSTLKLASCDTVAIDPHFMCETNVIGKKPTCLCFQQTSDDFFATRNPSSIFGKPIDLAFLDGMHWFEFLLRDFINVEKHCLPRSAIVLHDCLPPGFYMTSRDIRAAEDPRSAFQGWWAGDVWKIVPTLRKYRPDLSLMVTDSSPTGLVLITKLDPVNAILEQNFDSILGEFKEMDRAEFDTYWRDVDVTSVDRIDLASMYQPFSVG